MLEDYTFCAGYFHMRVEIVPSFVLLLRKHQGIQLLEDWIAAWLR